MIIDKVYLINLDISVDRFNKADSILKKVGGIFADYKRISGIYGKDLSIDYVKSITTPYSYYYLNNERDLHFQIDRVNAIGCYLSHVAVWKDMVLNNYQNIIILEDDILDFNYDIIMTYIDNLPIGVQIAHLHYTDMLASIKFNKINKYWYTSNHLLIPSAVAYLLNINLAKQFIEKSLPIDTHIDFYMNYYCINNNIPKYYSNKIIINTGVEPSIIDHNYLIIFKHELLHPYWLLIVSIVLVFVFIIFMIQYYKK